ncbi:MAG TPA: cyclic nucleotide-binding domain-containing protein [Gammaproteobacteria bacterium]|nr:cyclic nucleotide-binding domain-containing protein [Gammaproteobacteria bacterium]
MGGLIQTELLRNTPIFSSLSDEELQRIQEASENGIEEYEPKKLIIREDEIGDCMYIILEGTVEVMIRAESGGRDITINTLRAGDFFGERALMPGSTGRRNASIKSMHPTKLFRIDKKYVALNVKRDVDEDEEEEDITEINTARFEPDEVRDTIRKIRLFKSLNYDELKSIRDWTEVVTAGPGEFILKEAQAGEFMYVMLDGKVEIFTLDSDGKIVILATLKKGDYFGEQALMPDSKGKRNAFARTDNESRLVKIPKEYFRLMLNRDSELARELKKIHEEQKEKLKRERQG